MGFQLPTDPVLLWELSAIGGFSGDVTLTFGYDDTAFLPGFGAASLEVWHDDGSYGPLATPLDPVARTVTVETATLSPFALGAGAGNVPATPLWGPALLAVLLLTITAGLPSLGRSGGSRAGRAGQ